MIFEHVIQALQGLMHAQGVVHFVQPGGERLDIKHLAARQIVGEPTGHGIGKGHPHGNHQVATLDGLLHGRRTGPANVQADVGRRLLVERTFAHQQ